MRQDVIIVKDPGVAKLFADETRRRMLHILRFHEFSAADLARRLGKSPSSILHHLRLLLEAGLVEEARAEKRRNLVQTYYRSTARRFIVSYSLSDSLHAPGIFPWQREALESIVDELEAFGVEVGAEDRSRVTELLGACYLREQRALEGTLERLSRPVELDEPAKAAVVRILTQVGLSRDDEHGMMIEELGGLLRRRPDVGEGKS